jgi:hypothetical protein
MKCLLELLTRWFHAWKLEKIQAKKHQITKEQITKLMAGLAELTAAITDNTTAVTSVAAAIDNAVAKGIGGGTPPPDLQPAVDAIAANTTALNSAKDKLVAATPV